MDVVLVTGNAPYLGGPRTWLPLRRALPEATFHEIDTLDFADAHDVFDAVRARLQSALQGAHAIVAHGSAAGLAIEAVANVDASIGVVLLAPQYLTRARTPARALTALLAVPALRNALTAFARSKHRKLCRDEDYVRKQLRFMVRDDVLDDALLKEAFERIRDPRTERAVERTADVFLAVLRPIDPSAEAAVRSRVVLGAPMRSAPMLEAPESVADALRSLGGF